MMAVLLAIALDFGLGELPNRYHPLVFFGRWAARVEHYCSASSKAPRLQRLFGMVALTVALSPALPMVLLERNWLLDGLLLYFCIAARSLQQHAQRVRTALIADELPLARQRVGDMVSRQTGGMDAPAVRRAAIESVLENGADAVFAPLFWFAVLGPSGAVLYRLANTLDAMWGYKNQRYRYFGWAAARFDDLLNFVPARLTALTYAVLGNAPAALQAWRTQAALLESPNAGPVMAAGAGALNLELGGPASYHGVVKQKIWFGGVCHPENADIDRAVTLVFRALVLWVAAIGMYDYVA
ncbi:MULTISPECIES: adenosylcobinamide-phosphate synthase CbiB [Methylomonas]|uniref:adenosylcobinamide-phosphate synthase CbiB n=1 Tax=Methylomonas TaxID=416 RepID=UPI001E5C3C68|nr:adenosylcobinamide-phosphate synthase CbiB [Methylomonas rhizoryzae]